MTAAIYLAFEPEDASVAEAIAGAIEREGWSARRAAPGQRNADQMASLSQAISECTAVLAIISAGSEASDGLKREVTAAHSNGRLLIPVLRTQIAPESWLTANLDMDRQVAYRGDADIGRVVEAARLAVDGGQVIAMLNIKGGVGKTVLAANLFAAAHLIDKRSIAFVDLDPQHNLTQYFLPPAERARVRAEASTIYGALLSTGEASVPREAFAKLVTPLNRAKSRKQRFDLVAGDERLFEFTLDTRSEREKGEAFRRFRLLMSMLRRDNDAVVIDANPCATFLTRLAITAADHIVAPVRPETYSLTGLNMLEHVVRSIRGRPLRSGEFSVLLNGVNDKTRSDVHGDPDALTRAEIREAPFFGAALLPEEIPYSGALRAAPGERYAVNPINSTAMMRVGARQAKEALTRAAAAILRRAKLT